MSEDPTFEEVWSRSGKDWAKEMYKRNPAPSELLRWEKVERWRAITAQERAARAQWVAAWATGIMAVATFGLALAAFLQL